VAKRLSVGAYQALAIVRLLFLKNRLPQIVDCFVDCCRIIMMTSTAQVQRSEIEYLNPIHQRPHCLIVRKLILPIFIDFPPLFLKLPSIPAEMVFFGGLFWAVSVAQSFPL
jgi:hypothetical protein